jgi:OTT_1508-like deaminase
VVPCLKQGAEDQTDRPKALEILSWLTELQKASTNTSSLVTECYNARTSPLLQALDHYSLEGRPHNREFKDLRHYIGRLGAHRKATKTMVAAVVGMPGFLEAFSTKVEPSSRRAWCGLRPEDATAFGILGRMCPKDGAQQYRDILKFMDSSYGLNMDAGLAEGCTFKTRVHAELLLLDLFVRKEYDFVGDDRYIGCSKPACYSCYQ